MKQPVEIWGMPTRWVTPTDLHLYRMHMGNLMHTRVSICLQGKQIWWDYEEVKAFNDFYNARKNFLTNPFKN